MLKETTKKGERRKEKKPMIVLSGSKKRERGRELNFFFIFFGIMPSRATPQG